MSKKMIIAEGLSKRYVLGAFGVTSFRDELSEFLKKITSRKDKLILKKENARNKEFWALKDISFEIEEGDTLGLIGRNGAGKSTLLKILSRITTPTEGKFVMNGKVAALLEVGTGFHPDLSGIENVYLNGAILGMRRWEIRSKLASILEFSGIGEFADTPVKRYSSGMRVRLAFAVAAHLRQDILIVDEVLAVGDQEFQKKCLGKMGEVAREGRTVVFVSHNMYAISRLCRKGIYLKDGRIVHQGSISETIATYLKDSKGTQGSICWKEGYSDKGVDYFKLLSVSIENQDGKPENKFSLSDPISIRFEFVTTKLIQDFRLKINIRTADGITVLSFKSDDDPANTGVLQPGKHVYIATLPPKRLNQGSFSLSFLASLKNTRFLAQLDDILDFDIELFSRSPDQEEMIESSGILYPVVDWNYSSHSL